MVKKIKYCEICGVSNETKFASFDTKTNMILCQKHRCQFKNHNKFFDTSKITCNDLNEITIKDGVGYIHLYNKYGIEIYKSMIDVEDIPKCKNKRWRISKKKNKIYVVSGSKSNKMIYLSRFILDYYGELEVDHIDGESLNNQKNNLRIISRQNNILNLPPKIDSTTSIRGVSIDKRDDTYCVDFSYKNYRLYFKHFKNIESATYLRYLCEISFLKEFRHESNDDIIQSYISKLTKQQKEDIELYFNNKIKEINIED